jgi:RNA polymerase sigma factor (sigma-70 family)
MGSNGLQGARSLREGDDPDALSAELDEGFVPGEGTEIAAELRRGRAFNRTVAQRLDHRESTTRELSADYIHDLGQRGRLPQSLERRLLREAVAGDRLARAELTEAFLPLIGSVARNYRSSPRITRTELMQEGVVGLLRALERYDPELGVPFWAYASWWVRQAMQQLVAELTRPVVMSDRALRQLSEIKNAYASLGESPTTAQVSERTGLGLAQISNLLAADRPPKALEEPIEGEQGEVGMFGELVADPLAEDEYERVITSVAAGELRDLLSSLSEREREILNARYGLDREVEDRREIAGRLGLSSERVRQLEHRALGKLRAAAAEPSPPRGLAETAQDP